MGALLSADTVPLVFIGRDLSPEEPGLYYQDAGSFFERKRWGHTKLARRICRDPAPLSGQAQFRGPEARSGV
jgi:hypothetical protein